MAARTKSRFWRICGIYFRRFRMGMWLLILTVLGALLYLNQIGLPGFVKKPLLEKLRASGVDLQFTRLRWRFDRGIVAENVRFGRAEEPSSPQIYVKEVQVELDYKQLAKLRFQPNGLVLRQGHMSWPVHETNGTPRELTLESIQAELHLLPGDLWQLDDFQAQFVGAEIRLAGVLTNASFVREWKVMRAKRPSPVLLEDRLRRLADHLEQIHFSSPPQLKVDVRGDARELQSFSIRVGLNTPGAETPWGTVQNGTLSIVLSPATSNAWSRAEMNLQADSAQTRWANATNLQFVMHLSTGSDTNLVQGDLELTSSNFETKWGQAVRAHFTAHWLHSITNPIPLSGDGELLVNGASSAWGNAAEFRLAATLLATNTPVATDSSWAWWTNLAPYALDWECQVRTVQSPKLTAEEITCAGEWRAPRLTATRVASKLYGGKLDAEAELNVATRDLKFASDSDFDALKISPLLGVKAREWLAQFAWQKPPDVKGEGSLVLPAWTNLLQADWEAEVRPSLRLDGQFKIRDGSFRSVPFTSAESHFKYLDETWLLQDLMAVRPEGRLFLLHKASDVTRDFYFRFGSTINVRILRLLLDPAAQREFDLLSFTQAPVMDGEIWGRWREPERTGIKARVALTNFTVRGESASDFQSVLLFTNKVLKLVEPRLHRGAQTITASSLSVDFGARKIYLTNGYSTADPAVVARAIGPQVGRVLEPYRFLRPPSIRAEGVIPMRDTRDADIRFEVDGGPFEWWKFRMPRISGKVDWKGEKLTLEDLQAQFYQGAASGNAAFDFRAKAGADFSFSVVATDADMHSLMNDLTGKSNKLEGLLTMRLSVTEANSADWQSWQGKGRVNLRDGLIWEIPVFGILSPALDNVVPGLGSSRASEGAGTFDITNGVVRTSDLEIKASIMRLQYWGSVNLQGDVDGRVQAELLRDTWVVGPLLSLVLWPVSKVFEYEVSGTLEAPRSQPVFFVPKILLMPFRGARSPVKEPVRGEGPGSIQTSPRPSCRNVASGILPDVEGRGVPPPVKLI